MATADAESPVRVGKKRSFDAAFYALQARPLLVVDSFAGTLRVLALYTKRMSRQTDQCTINRLCTCANRNLSTALRSAAQGVDPSSNLIVVYIPASSLRA